jgi:hypothetical protein
MDAIEELALVLFDGDASELAEHFVQFLDK